MPWRKPWDSEKAGNGWVAPRNGESGRQYHGINQLVLGCSPRTWTTGDPRWYTFESVKKSHEGASVKAEEKATTVYFYKPIRVKETASDGTETERDTRVIKSYSVFHASQCSNVPAYVAPQPQERPSWQEPGAVREILDESGIPIHVGGDVAAYVPAQDVILMPVAASFVGDTDEEKATAWAATALHELGHASMTDGRTNIAEYLKGKHGSAIYARGEVRAELASVFLSSTLGIEPPVENSAAYIQSWLSVLKDDPREIFRAAADAQKIHDFVMDTHPGYKAAADAEQAANAPVEKPPGWDALPDHVKKAIDAGTLEVIVAAPEQSAGFEAPAGPRM